MEPENITLVNKLNGHVHDFAEITFFQLVIIAGGSTVFFGCYENIMLVLKTSPYSRLH